MLVTLKRLAADFDASFENRAVLDDNARGIDIALDAAGGAEHDAVASAQVPLDNPAHDDLAGFYIGLDVAVWSDGDAGIGHMSRTDELAVNRDFAFAGEIALDANAASENG